MEMLAALGLGLFFLGAAFLVRGGLENVGKEIRKFRKEIAGEDFLEDE